MITHDTLKVAARTLPPHLRDKYYAERSVIRERIAKERWAKMRSGHYQVRNLYNTVPWDDPEFLAACMQYLVGLNNRVQSRINLLSGDE